MDVTNPGLVSVADQAPGNPDTSVPALSVPFQTDALVAAGDAGHPAGADSFETVDSPDRVFPTPVEFLAGTEQLPPASQRRGTVPGTAPSYAPFPPPHNEVVVGLQDVPQAGTSEFTVAGPRTSIQTNLNPGVERTYTVASVLDADTGGAVVEPAASESGTFTEVFDETVSIRFVSPAVLPPSLVDGTTVQVTSSSGKKYDLVGIVSGVVSEGGAITTVRSANGGLSIIASTDDASLANAHAGDVVSISGTGVVDYDTSHRITSIQDLTGSFTEVRDAGNGMIALISSTPTGLVVGDEVTLSGSYSGPHAVAAVSNYSGAFQSVTDAGGGKITVHVASMPAGVQNGQFVTLAGAVYAGTYQISGVAANTFDCSPVGGYSATDSGTLVSRTAQFIVGFTTNYAGTWSCRSFTVDIAYSSDATGAWCVANFILPGTYDGTAAGTWSYYLTDVVGTTRYRLGLAPADLDSFGVSLQGREVVFTDPTLTAADSGASREVQFAGAGFVVIGKYDADSDVPVMTTPQAGDQLSINVQREGAQMFVEHLGQVVAASPQLGPPVTAASPVFPSQPRGVTVNSSTGAQPGQPVVGHGTQVPTAVNVEVAAQATTVGLPVNVFA